MTNLPSIIQGGMGVGVSNWQLASAVARRGQLGVVSGTAISHVVANRLFEGDPAGHIRAALAEFPFQDTARRMLSRWFREGGPKTGEQLPSHPIYSIAPPRFLDQITAMSNFVEVHLARRGHSGQVGLNLLEKIQLPTLASLYGAMLAGVDWVLMGAGIPTQVAGILDRLSRHEAVSYRLDVKGEPAGPRSEATTISFDPERIFPGIAARMGPLKRPRFVPIVSSVVLASALIKRSEGEIDGFIVELPVAGGHNAPPRGKMTLTNAGEPIYGPKDEVALDGMAALGKPFWLAGGYGRMGALAAAQASGAAGIQVGTAFALCHESGVREELRMKLLERVARGEADMKTSPVASPTGFPFKVAQMEGTMSEAGVYDARPRLCDVGMLRTLVRNDDGTVVYRCPAEPVEDYVAKGGRAEDTEGRRCLCNNLLSTAGVVKVQKGGYAEAPIVTIGDDFPLIGQFQSGEQLSYSAGDVLRVLLA